MDVETDDDNDGTAPTTAPSTAPTTARVISGRGGKRSLTPPSISTTDDGLISIETIKPQVKFIQDEDKGKGKEKEGDVNMEDDI